MAKRHADETATNKVVALSQTASSHAPYSKNVHTEIHQNAPKRLHLSPPNDITTSAGRVEQEDASTYKNIDKQSMVNSSGDEQSSRSSDEPPDKSRQASSDLDIQIKIHGSEQTEEAQDASKHLVKTISDLPVFVTIEGYRVASYLIDGEPHLCLPQLLKFVQKIFPLNRVIDKFEEYMTNFVSATPKQVEGFIKAIVLPQDATACPLIKRSDAEWICLALYDQHHKERLEDLISSKAASTSKDNLESAQKNSQASPIDACKRNTTPKDRVHDVGKMSSEIQARNSHNDRLSEQSFRSYSVRNSEISANDPGQQYVTSQEAFETKSRKPTASATSSPSAQETEILEGRESSSPSKKSKVHDVPSTNQSASNTSKEKFFETEAQDTILNLARTVTSTLMIQVYHRCFGKCVGLYYPSLLNNSESNCIECSICHKMLSPRRFIGHTHGVKEVNVCHWGFNSYHWRSYIRLSRKQSMNNLDDDELLVQFNQLKSVKDEGTDMAKDFQPSSSEKEMKSSNYVNQVARNLDLAKKRTSQPHLSIAHWQESIMKDVPSDLSARASTSQTASEEHSKFMPARSEPLPFHTIGSSAINLSSLDKISSAWNIEQLTGTFSRKTSLPACIPQASPQRLDTLKSSSANHLCRSIVSPQPSTSSDYQSSPSFLLDSINKVHANLELLRLYRDANNAHLATGKFSSAFPQLATESLIKQDLFVSTSLTNYLNARGIPSQMVQEIVSTTLSLIHKARSSY